MQTINTFASDNISGACPEVIDVLARANEGSSPSYGEDPWTKNLALRLEEIFELTDRVPIDPLLSMGKF